MSIPMFEMGGLHKLDGYTLARDITHHTGSEAYFGGYSLDHLDGEE